MLLNLSLTYIGFVFRKIKHPGVFVTKMSDDKRKQCRTQGRFSGGSSSWKQSKPAGAGSTSNSNTSKIQSDNRQYEMKEGSYTSKSQVSPNTKTEKYVQEISQAGFTKLSETENGVSRIYYKPDFLSKAKSTELFEHFITTTEFQWEQKDIVIRGERHKQPRLVAWFGPLPYTYSGVTLEKRDFTDTILGIKRDVENVLKQECELGDIELNSVLLNRYRDGKDSVAWHSDDELSMGVCPTIASVSLGDTRRFEMRRKEENVYHSTKDADFVVHLEHGSLLIMDGVMQKDWQHQVPKEFHNRNERINLTFRTVFPHERIQRKPRQAFLTERFPNNPNPVEKSSTRSAPPAPFVLDEGDFPAL